MTWISRMAAFCVTVLLMCFALEGFGDTLHDCQEDCKDQPDDPVCSRRNFTSDSGSRDKISRYQWLRNECERKCFSNGDFKRVANMELCYQKGQNRTTYICSLKYFIRQEMKQCMSNASWHGN